MGRKKAGHRKSCIRRLRKTALLFKNGEQPDLFDLELVADGVADMAFTHGAGHAVNFKCDLIHIITSCAFAAALRLDKANHLSKKQTRRDFFCRYHTAKVGRSQEEKQYGKNEGKRAEKGLDNRG